MADEVQHVHRACERPADAESSNVVRTKHPGPDPGHPAGEGRCPDPQAGRLAERADRDDSEGRARRRDADGDRASRSSITNTSKTDEATGARRMVQGQRPEARRLTPSSATRDVDMDSLTYPADWSTLVLKPGDSVERDRHAHRVRQGQAIPTRTAPTSPAPRWSNARRGGRGPVRRRLRQAVHRRRSRRPATVPGR